MLRIGKMALLILCNVLSLASIAIFARSFFGEKPYLSELEDYRSAGFVSPSPPAPAPFDKVVFMVVDALRRLAPVSSM
jgi:ethanolaminephosphotransferase